MHKLHKRFTRNRQILAFFITVMVMLAVGLTLRVSATANLSFVSDFGIKSVSDGTAPFNDNNEPGNDSDDNNGIIRSFDYVNYALSYVTELMPGQKVVEQGKLMTEFELSAPPSAVEFNMDTLNWMLDQKMTYYYTDGGKTIEFQGLDKQKVWDILFEDGQKCTVVEDPDKLLLNGEFKKKLDISTNIPVLGCENKSISISENGYLFTNILNKALIFNIGEEKAKNIIDYVKNNCKGYELVYREGDNSENAENASEQKEGSGTDESKTGV